MNNPTVVILTDRNDRRPAFLPHSRHRFNCQAISKQAGDREQLKELLKVNSGGVILPPFKIQPEDGSNACDMLSERHHIIVIADEAHRSQYGFAAKEVDVKTMLATWQANARYGFAKHLRDALPNATYLGFTGQPIEKKMSTPHRCLVIMLIFTTSDLCQVAVEDGATVRIFYESRLAKDGD